MLNISAWSICARLVKLTLSLLFFFFFFNDTATTEIYTLSLHDALPIWRSARSSGFNVSPCSTSVPRTTANAVRSEEHTSELQSPCNLVCRLLLEKKKNTQHEQTEVNTRHSRRNVQTSVALQRL